jgi:hypothetical protein
MRQSLIILAIGMLLGLIVFVSSCERDCNCLSPEDHIPEYHLIYPNSGIEGVDVYDSSWVLTYSTKTGEVIDSFKTTYYINDIQFTRDGSMAVWTATNLSVPEHVVWVTNYPIDDTIAFRGGLHGERLAFNPDETRIMLHYIDAITILSFPDLTPILTDTVQHNDAGFLPGVDKYFHVVGNKDSLYVVDYSNPESIVTTAIFLASPPDIGISPYIGVVDYERNLITLICEPDEEYSYIHVRDASDYSFVQQNVTPVHYHDRAFARPGSDEIFMYSIETGWSWWEMDRLDYYSVELNAVFSFMKRHDIVLFEGKFAFDQIEFTPDGETMYLGHVIPLGVRIADKKVIQRLQPKIPAARVIRINPRDFSQ